MGYVLNLQKLDIDATGFAPMVSSWSGQCSAVSHDHCANISTLSVTLCQ
jgi:hypothetical protein